MSVLSAALESAAIAVVFTRGTIFARVRESGPSLWREFASCALCVGVWVGAAWSAAGASRSRESFTYLSALDALAAGAWAGVLALTISLVLDVLDKHAV